MQDFKETIKQKEYDFLRENPEINDGKIILLGLGGSHAYGTNNESSDLDIRGIAVNSAENILSGKDFEQVVDVETDTTIYSVNKIFKLLYDCNPNTIEILGLKPEHYLHTSYAGDLLLQNKHLFLSKKAIHSFGGYANSQLRRLENKSARLTDQTHQEQNILNSINHASVMFSERYENVPPDGIKLYVDKTDREGYDSEIFCDIHLDHYPLRDHKSMFSDMQAIISGYKKMGKRNEKAIEHNKLGKHMMHLVRLYLMAFDILENGEIITYREKDHDFLMDIRNGKYLDDDRQVLPEFYDIVDEYENKLNKLAKTTSLPETPDRKKIDKLLIEINWQTGVRKYSMNRLVLR